MWGSKHNMIFLISLCWLRTIILKSTIRRFLTLTAPISGNRLVCSLLRQRDRSSQRRAIKISDIEHSGQISVTQISHRIRNFILPLQRICKLINQSDFAVLSNDLENRVRWKLDGWKSERRKSCLPLGWKAVPFFIESKEHSNRQEKKLNMTGRSKPISYSSTWKLVNNTPTV